MKAPSSLQKRGLQAVRTNVPGNQTVAVSDNVLNFLGDEVRQVIKSIRDRHDAEKSDSTATAAAK